MKDYKKYDEKYNIISIRNCNKNPHDHWWEIYKAVFSLRTNLSVINTHFNQLVKWCSEQENNEIKEKNIELLNKVLNNLDNWFSTENDRRIKELKDNISSILPREEYEPFAKKIKKPFKDE